MLSVPSRLFEAAAAAFASRFALISARRAGFIVFVAKFMNQLGLGKSTRSRRGGDGRSHCCSRSMGASSTPASVCFMPVLKNCMSVLKDIPD